MDHLENVVISDLLDNLLIDNKEVKSELDIARAYKFKYGRLKGLTIGIAVDNPNLHRSLSYVKFSTTSSRLKKYITIASKAKNNKP